MILPTQEEQDEVLDTRPGDEIYPKVKPDLKRVGGEAAKLRTKLLDIILADMVRDMATSHALNHVSAVLNYLPQEPGLDIPLTPAFDGEKLMGGLSRIGQLKLSIDYSKLVGMDAKSEDAVLQAEVRRLWGDPGNAMLKKLLADKAKAAKTVHSAASPTGVKADG